MNDSKYTIEDWLEHLGPLGYTPKQVSTNEWAGACPRCEDGEDRFVITEKDGMALIHCRQCSDDSPTAYREMVEIVFGDGQVPSPSPPPAPHPEADPLGDSEEEATPRSGKVLTATYNYHKEDGSLGFTVERYDRDGTKSFSILNAKRERKKPRLANSLVYRYPEVLAAAQRGDPVFIVEGEKCVDRIINIGFVATCCAGGSGAWSPTHAATLPEGVAVILIPDADASGLNYAMSVGCSMRRRAGSLTVIDPFAMGYTLDRDTLSDGGGQDIADWLEGRDADAFRHLRDSAEDFTAWLPGAAALTGQEILGVTDLNYLVQHVMRRWGDQLLLVNDGKAGQLRYMDPETGRWTEESSRLMTMFSTLDRELFGTTAPNTPERYAQGFIKKRGAADEFASKAVGIVNDLIDAGLMKEEDVLRCRISEFDQDLRYIGCRNGIVDLWEAELLDPKDGAKALVTKTTGVNYNPEATHPQLDQLFTHLPVDVSEFYWDIIGFHFHGNPRRRIYNLVGPKRGGKSTLMTALWAAGGDYVRVVQEDLFKPGKSSNSGLSNELEVVACPVRIALADEVATRKLDGHLLKKLSGSGPLAFRRNYEHLQEKRGTGTLILSFNKLHEPLMAGNDDALDDRLVVIPCPAVREEDGTLQQVIHEEGFKEAVLARAVLRAARVGRTEVPAPPDTVREATSALIKESRGDLGDIADAMKPVEGSRSWTIFPWRAYADAHGATEMDTKINNLSRKGFLAKLRQLNPNLPEPVKVRIESQSRQGWPGWTLTGDYAQFAFEASTDVRDSCGTSPKDDEDPLAGGPWPRTT